MALHTFGTTATTALQAIQFVETPSTTFDQDLGNLNAIITPPVYFGTPGTVTGSMPAAKGAAGIIVTGNLNSGTAVVTNLTAITGAPIAAIQQGQVVLSQYVTPGTFVVSSTTNTLTLSQVASATTTAGYIAMVPPVSDGQLGRNGLLIVPHRGVLKLGRNDIVAVDNTGWPILVPAASVGYGGSAWTFV